MLASIPPTSRRSAFGLGLLAVLASSLSAQTVLRVDVNANGGATGLTWADAFPDLQAALTAMGAGPGEIWVAQGTYHPVAPGATTTFELADRVALYGGFAGTEVNRGQRDPAAHETTLSVGANTRHIVTGSGIGRSAVLDGFTVAGGNGSAAGGGGALWLEGASPTVRRCLFTGSVGYFGCYGVAVRCSGGTPLFEDCRFENNYGVESFGAAIAALDQAHPTLRRCVFVANVVERGVQPGGGAAYLHLDCATRFEGCSFFGNSSRHASFESSIYPAVGGAILSLAADTVIDGCAFGSNQSEAGGSIYTFRSLEVRSSTFAHERAFRAGFGFNVGGYGGAIASDSYGQTTGARLFENCTFVRCTATDSGGGIWSPSDQPVQLNTVRNCVFRECTDADGLHNKAQCSGVRPRYSDVHGLLVAVPGEDPIDPTQYPGCFDADPLFLDTDGPNGILGDADDDLRLSANSPCVESGDPASPPTGFDGFGNQRTLDGDWNGVQRVDVGAHELAGVFLSATLVPAVGGQRLSATVTGDPGRPLFLLIGFAGPEAQHSPWGSYYFARGAPWRTFALGATPATYELFFPSRLAPSIRGPLVLQALALGGAGAGQVTAPALLDLRGP